MLPLSNRLRHSAQFGRVVRSGARAGRASLVVHVAPSEADERARVGFVVSKAVGNAVQRNVVRRRLRAIVRPLVTTPQEPARGFDVIIRALPAARDASFDALTADVTAALRQARSRVRVGRP